MVETALQQKSFKEVSKTQAQTDGNVTEPQHLHESHPQFFNDMGEILIGGAVSGQV